MCHLVLARKETGKREAYHSKNAKDKYPHPSVFPIIVERPVGDWDRRRVAIRRIHG
jgi:hypothetical protein